MESEKNDFHRDVIVSGLAEAANLLFRFLAGVLVARGLGAEGRGVYALALAAPGLLLGLTNIGLGEATTVLIGKGEYPKARVLASMNFLMLLIAAAGFAVYFGLSPLVMKALKQSLPEDIYLLAFCVFPLTLFWGGNASAALGLSLVRKVAAGRLLNNAFFMLAAAALYFKGFGVKAVLWAFILASVLENAYLMFHVGSRVRPGLAFDPEMIRRQASLGWHVFWGGLFTQVTRRLDIFLVNFFSGPGQLGVYVVAYSVAEFLLTVPSIYSRAAFSSAAVSGGRSGFGVSNSALRQALLLMAAAGLLLALVMRPFISAVYTPEFLTAVAPALLLIPGVVLFGLSSLLGNIFTGYSRPQEPAKAAALACAVTIALDLLLIPRFGIMGAAAASVAAYGAGTIWLLRAYLGFSGSRISEALLAGRADLSEYSGRLRKMLGRGD